MRVWVDSETAKAITSRLRLGKVRHMEVRFLWAQEALRNKRFEVCKVRGEENPADVLTKAMSVNDFKTKMVSVGLRLDNPRIPLSSSVRSAWSELSDCG